MAEGVIAKWFTRAKKFPILLGKFPDGTRIPGGPYTQTQGVFLLGWLILGGTQIDRWGTDNLLYNLVLLAGSGVGLTYAIGKLPTESRNPLRVLQGLVQAVTAPTAGIYQGTRLHIASPRKARHQVQVLPYVLRGQPSLPAAADRGLDPQPAPRAPSNPAPVPAEAPATTTTRPKSGGRPGRSHPKNERQDEPRRPALTGVQRALAMSAAARDEEGN